MQSLDHSETNSIEAETLGEHEMTKSIKAAKTPSPKGRRAEILDATLRVISNGGVDSVTHRKVSAEGDMSIGKIKRHFS
jgi:DNA-binding transcriptional regulator YbjK